MSPDAPREYKFTHIEIRPLAASAHDQGGLLIEWGAEDIGFGQLYVYTSADGALRALNETVSRKFVAALLAELGRRVELEDGPDSPRGQ